MQSVRKASGPKRGKKMIIKGCRLLARGTKTRLESVTNRLQVRIVLFRAGAIWKAYCSLGKRLADSLNDPGQSPWWSSD